MGGVVSVDELAAAREVVVAVVTAWLAGADGRSMLAGFAGEHEPQPRAVAAAAIALLLQTHEAWSAATDMDPQVAWRVMREEEALR